MKSNAGKCLLLDNTNNNMKIANVNTTDGTCEKLLRVKFDHKLTFDDHISELWKKASIKIHALVKVIEYANILEKHIMDAFFKS